MNLKINPLFFFFGYGLVFFPLLLLIGPLFSELFLISVIIFSLFFIIKEIFFCRKKMKDEFIYNKKEICKAILVSAIFINLWPLIPSGNFFNNWMSMLYFYPIGFHLYFKHQNDQKIN